MLSELLSVMLSEIMPEERLDDGDVGDIRGGVGMKACRYCRPGAGNVRFLVAVIEPACSSALALDV